MAARIELTTDGAAHGWRLIARNGATVAVNPKPCSTKGNARRQALAAVEAVKDITKAHAAGVVFPAPPPEVVEP